MDELLLIPPQENEDAGTISLSDTTNTPAPPMDEKVLDARSNKYAFSLGTSPGAIRDIILTGGEVDLRSQASVTADLAENRKKLDMVSSIIKSGRTLTPEEMQMVIQSEPEFNDPNTVLEKLYARKMTETVMAVQPESSTPFADSMKKVIENQVTRKEILQKYLEDEAKSFEVSSIGSKFIDVGSTFLPFWEQTRTAGIESFVPGGKSFGLGDWLYTKSQELWNITDPTAFRAKVMEVGSSIPNPVMRLNFIRAMIGYSTGEKWMDQMGLFDLAIPGGIALRAGGKVIDGATYISKAKGFLEAAMRRDARPEDVLNSIGHVADAVKTAAVRTWEETLKGVDPNNDLEVLQRKIPHLFHPEKWMDKTTLDPTKTEEFIKYFKSQAARYLSILTDVNAPTRLPEELQFKAIALAFEDWKKIHTGVEKGVLNVRRILPEEHRAQSDQIEIRLGKPNAIDTFDSPIQAHNAAKNEYKLGKDQYTLVKAETKNLDFTAGGVKYKLEGDGTSRKNTKGKNTTSKTTQYRDSEGNLHNTPAVGRIPVETYGTGMKYVGKPIETVRQGDGWVIRMTHPIKETAEGIREAYVKTAHNTPNDGSVANGLFAGVRNPDDVLSKFQRENRLAATHGLNQLQQIVLETIKDIGRMDQKSLDALEKVFLDNRDRLRNMPRTPNKVMGEFYYTEADFRAGFSKLNGRQPTDQEFKFYANYVQLNELDWLVRNLGRYRDKLRLNYHNVEITTTWMNKDKKPTKTVLSSVEATPIDVLDFSGHNKIVAIISGDGTKNKYYITSRMSNPEKAMLRRVIDEEGFKAWELYDKGGEGAQSFQNLFGTKVPIDVVITDAHKVTPLSIDQLSHVPGGHVRYDQRWFVKTPQWFMTPDGVKAYAGDKPILVVSTQREADHYSKYINEALQHLRNGDDAKLNKVLQEHLPTDWTIEKFKKMFDDVDGSYKKEDDFFTVYDRTHASDAPGFVGRYGDDYINNISDKQSPKNLIDNKYASSRDPDLPSVEFDGLAHKLTSPRLIDPLKAASNILGDLANTRLMRNYQYGAAESFVARYHDVLNVDLADLRRNPIAFLYNKDIFKENVPPQLRAKLKVAKAERNAMVQFVGAKGGLEQDIDALLERVLNVAYDKGGQKFSNYLDSTKLMQTRNPVDYIKSIGAHLKFGFFNPVQFWMQAQTVAHTLAIAPLHGAKSFPAAMVANLARLTEDANVIRGLAKYVPGWTADEFHEALTAMRRAGIEIVGREMAYRDTLAPPSVYTAKGVGGMVKTFLDKGMIPFQEGERFARTTAFLTSYREWRSANKYKPLDNASLNSILRRADDMTVNMTRASLASWQKGPLAIPTQFWTFTTHLTEQMMSKRLSNAEKLRLVGTYSALYGVPIGVLGTSLGPLSLYPWSDDIKRKLLENDVDTSNPAVDAMLNGIPDVAIKMIFGHDYNIAERFGPNGLSIVREAMNGDAGFLEVLFGAPGSIANGLLSALDPFGMQVRNIFSDYDDQYPLTGDDFVQALREISSVNSAVISWGMLNANKYVTKHGVVVGDADGFDAFMRLTFGVDPQKVNDSFLMIRSMKDIREHQEAIIKKMREYNTKWADAASKGDWKAADIYAKKAHSYYVMGGFTLDQQADVFRRTTPGMLDLYDQARSNFDKKVLQGQ